MTQLNPYLAFDGNCKEAMTFYKECLGGDLSIQIVKDTPMAEKMPPETQNQVMHSALTQNGTAILFASDMMGHEPYQPGNMVTLSINCTSEEEIRSLFKRLSEGGKIGMDLKEEFWGAIFGYFTDRFGMRWMLNYQKPKV